MSANDTVYVVTLLWLYVYGETGVGPALEASTRRERTVGLPMLLVQSPLVR